MQSLILGMVVLTLCGQNLANKFYNQKSSNQNVYIHSGVCCLASMLFFMVISVGKADFDISVLPYSCAFAVAFGGATLFMTLAIKYGQLSLSALFNAYALLIPTAAGVLLWNEKVSIYLILGMLCLILSLFLIYFKSEGKTITTKWLIFAFLAFLCNGMCSVVQRCQQINFKNQYSSYFMIVALFISSIIMLILGKLTAPKAMSMALKNNWRYGAALGVLNGLTNYGVIKLNEVKFPASIMFPIISAGSIILTFVCSFILFKEKLSKRQLIGASIGVVAIVFFCI